MNKQLKKNAKLMKAILTAANILVALGALSLSAPAGAARLAYVGAGAWATPGCSERHNLSTLTAVAEGSGYPCQAAVTMDYFFDVLSSTGVTPFAEPVPVLVTTSLSAYASAMYGAYAMASVDLNGTVYVCSPCSPYTDLHPSFSGDFARIAYTGIDYNNRVEVIVRVDITNWSTSAYALADPYIRIDPAFQATHPDYYLNFSSNVTNAPPVPIPAAVWLFGSGLLGLIGVARRKARTA